MSDMAGAALDPAEDRIKPVRKRFIALGTAKQSLAAEFVKSQAAIGTDQVPLDRFAKNRNAAGRIENGRAKNGLVEKTIEHRFKVAFQAHFLGTAFTQVLLDRLSIMCLGQVDGGLALVATFTDHLHTSLVRIRLAKRSGWPGHS